LDVVPLGAKFGSFDGQIIVTVEGAPYRHLRAIDWSGKVTDLIPTKEIPYAESINFVPLNLGASATPIEGLYLAVYTPDVIKADGSQFAKFKGDAIVGSEYYGVWRVHWNGTAFETTVLDANPGQLEDGIFVTPNMIDPPGAGCPAKGKDKSNGDDSDSGKTRASRPLTD